MELMVLMGRIAKMITKRKDDNVNVGKFHKEHQFFKELYALMKKYDVNISAAIATEEYGIPSKRLLFNFLENDFVSEDSFVDYSVDTSFEKIYEDDEEDLKEQIAISGIADDSEIE